MHQDSREPTNLRATTTNLATRVPLIAFLLAAQACANEIPADDLGYSEDALCYAACFYGFPSGGLCCLDRFCESSIPAAIVCPSCEDNGPFDADFYGRYYPDLERALGSNPERLCRHFREHGLDEQRQSRIDFDVNFYRSTNIDLRRAFGRDLERYWRHYQEYGEEEGRYASYCAFPFFDADYYSSRHADLQAAFGDDPVLLCRHWRQHGIQETRRASRHFDLGVYRRSNADLHALNNRQLIRHYAEWGRHEGRRIR